MPDKELGQLLKDLDEQMNEGGEIDDSDREALRDLQIRIASMLDTDSKQSGEHESVSESIADYIDRFESSYPTLTMTLGRIMDALSKIGI